MKLTAMNCNLPSVFATATLLMTTWGWAQEISLFNGKNFQGWKLPAPNHWWSIDNGILVGENKPGKPAGNILLTERSFGDVSFQAEVRWSKDADSGVYPRGSVMQCQIGYSRSARKDMTGSLFVEGGQGYVREAVNAQSKLRQGDWNTIRIDAIGSHYSIWINGAIVLDTQLPGFDQPGPIGLQVHTKPQDMKVEFRNVRLKDLSPSVRSSPLATIQTDANQPRIEVVKDQGPNATEWALTPLDENIPGDIRQNLTYLREDLLDEAKKNPKAAAAAYTLASEYCDKILNALDQRDLVRVNAGYSAAQADAGVRVTSQALEARRNYKMSWPQYAREESQRAELYRQQAAGADVSKQQIKVSWANKAVKMRAYLDDLYTKLRAAMR